MYVSPRLAIVAVAAASVTALAPITLVVGLIVANVLLIGLLLFDIWQAPHPSALGIERFAPSALTTHEVGRVTLRLQNPGNRSLSVAIRDATPRSGARTPVVHRNRIGSHGGMLEAQMVPGRRGRLELGPVTVRVSGPIGLGGRQATLPIVDTVRVYPALPGRSEVELRIERARMLQSGQRSSRHRGGGTDFDSLRDYHPDDEFRRINWTATARAAKPITNLYREDRDQQIVLLLDAGRTMAGTIAGLSRFEHALDAAIALAELATRAGDHVGVMAFASGVEATLSPRGGRDQPRRALELLFDLEPSLDPTDYRGAFGTLLSRHRRRSLLVLFTDLTEESVMQPLFDALPVLLPRHLLMIGSIVDPEVLALRSALPRSYEDAYLSAAAAQSLSARNRASAHLRSRGVIVEDREPGRLAGALADRYLQIKSAARL
ncbi:MAG TPA: DUF58 domain-containing protein [Actinomycetota bacterium]